MAVAANNNGQYALRTTGISAFLPWPPNVRRRVRNRTIELQRVIDQIQAKPDIGDFLIGNLPNSIWYKTLQARRLIDEIRALQRFAMPDSIAALDRWSDEPRRGSNIVLRISHGALVYHDGPDHCEIEIPDALTKPLRVPSTPDSALERIWSEPERDPITPERRSVSGPSATSSDVRYCADVAGQADVRRATGHNEPFYWYTA